MSLLLSKSTNILSILAANALYLICDIHSVFQYFNIIMIVWLCHLLYFKLVLKSLNVNFIGLAYVARMFMSIKLMLTSCMLILGSFPGISPGFIDSFCENSSVYSISADVIFLLLGFCFSNSSAACFIRRLFSFKPILNDNQPNISYDIQSIDILIKLKLFLDGMTTDPTKTICNLVYYVIDTVLMACFFIIYILFSLFSFIKYLWRIFYKKPVPENSKIFSENGLTDFICLEVELFWDFIKCRCYQIFHFIFLKASAHNQTEARNTEIPSGILSKFYNFLKLFLKSLFKDVEDILSRMLFPIMIPFRMTINRICMLVKDFRYENATFLLITDSMLLFSIVLSAISCIYGVNRKVNLILILSKMLFIYFISFHIISCKVVLKCIEFFFNLQINNRSIFHTNHIREKYNSCNDFEHNEIYEFLTNLNLKSNKMGIN